LTVQREFREIVNANFSTVATAVNKILNSPGIYKNPKVSSDQTVFTFTARSNPLVLPTTMIISLEALNSMTKITIRAKSPKSQWWMIGDVFGAYDRLIRDFLALLRSYIDFPIRVESSE
jgi:hypothetical protein